MGRHRTRPDDKENCNGHVDSETARTIQERLGLHDLVCTDCQLKNPPEADKCRSCGCTQLRKKANDFRGKSESG